MNTPATQTQSTSLCDSWWFWTVIAVAAAVVIVAIVLAVIYTHVGCPTCSGSTLADCDARANFRKLWSDHVYLTHDFIAAAFNGSEDLSQVTSRLLQNQADIGNAFRAKYGDAAADRITQLFRDHILIAADVVADVKSGDQAKLFQDQQRWKQNAQQIAAYLCSLNLNTRPDCVQAYTDMLYHHLEVTTQEVVAYSEKRYQDSIKYLDEAHTQALEMADVFYSDLLA